MITFTLHAKMLKPALASLIVISSLTLSSCQDEDFGYTADQIAYQTNFKKRFGDIPDNKSWDLSLWSNWKDPIQNTRALTRAGGTPTKGKLQENSHFSYGSEWIVPNKLLNWMKENLVEGRDNRFLGSDFILQLPDNDFAIIPIFQGQSAICSDLEIKVNDYQITKIWSKSDNMWVQEGSSEWQKLGYFNGWESLTKFVSGKADDPYPLHSASTLNADNVKTKPIIFNSSQISGGNGNPYMYLSLINTAKSRGTIYDHTEYNPETEKWDIHKDKLNPESEWSTKGKYASKMWDENNEWTTIGDRLTSINSKGYMLALTVPWSERPAATDLPSIGNGRALPSQILIIGCEDANGAGSDHDNNDIAFMIVGYPDVPQVIPTTHIMKKRYMCEDLGNNDDFDFNDIVVDVTQTTKYTLTTDPSDRDDFRQESFEITGLTETDKVQKAKIAHVCGTLPIQVQVGDLTFNTIQDPTDDITTRYDLSNNRPQTTRAIVNLEETDGWNPNEERVIPNNSWNPATNNIRIWVDWKKWNKTDSSDPHQTPENLFATNDQQSFGDYTSGNVKTVSFPKNGTIPYIIAVDPDVPWMKERQAIPSSWITGNLSDHTGAAAQGSSIYYDGYGTDKGEPIIWEGSVKGQAFKTSLSITEDHYLLGIKEASTKGYNIINVYTKAMSDGSIGRIGLYKADGETPLLGSASADSYLQGAANTNGTCKTSVMLKSTEIEEFYKNGIVIQSRTNGLEIIAVTLSRIYDGDIPWYQTGRTVMIQKPAGGTITAKDRQRERKADDVGYGVPFENALYPYSINYAGNGSNHEACHLVSYVDLVATADFGQAFDHWTVNDQAVAETSNTLHYEVTKGTGAIKIGAVFATANDNTLVLSRPADINVSVMAGASYNIMTSSNNNVTGYIIGDYDNRYITVDYNSATSLRTVTVNALAVGETSFTIKQPDGKDGSSRHYNASQEITITVNVLKVPTVSVPLETATMYHEWTAVNASAAIANSTASCGGWAKYGDSSVNGKNFTDLTSSDWLVATGTSDSNIRFLFNRETMTGDGSFLEMNANVSLPVANANKYLTVVTNNDGSKSYVVSLKAMREDYGYVHLNCIKTNNDGDSNIKTIMVDKYDCPFEKAMTPLTLDMYYEWSSESKSAFVVNNVPSQGGETWLKGEAVSGNCNTIYGCPHNYSRNYVDLSSASMLIATVTSGDAPNFLFNREYDPTSQSPGWGPQIYVNGNNEDYCTIIGKEGEARTYIMDLNKFRQKYGYTHLNSVCTLFDNSATTTINGLYVDTYECNAETVNTWDNLSDLSSLFFGNINTTLNSSECVEGSIIWGSYPAASGNYVDVSDYKYMKVVATSGAPHIIFNQSSGKDFVLAAKNMFGDGHHPVDWEIVEEKDQTIFYIKIADVKALGSLGYAHLHLITADYIGGATTKVTSISLGK